MARRRSERAARCGAERRSQVVAGVRGRLRPPATAVVCVNAESRGTAPRALLGTAIVCAAGWADTSGGDWLEILSQVVLAALSVAVVAGFYRRRAS